MNQQKQRVPDYLGHILEAIERIRRYTDEIDVQNDLSGLYRKVQAAHQDLLQNGNGG